MIYPKESDYTNICCNKCGNKITYEYVSFQGNKCKYNNIHYTTYSIKCSKCKEGYGSWNQFDKTLFPGYNINECPCIIETTCTCKYSKNIFLKCKVCWKMNWYTFWNPPDTYDIYIIRSSCKYRK